MTEQMIAYLFAMCVGLVSSGLIASIWELGVGDKASLVDNARLDFLLPLRGLVFIFTRPVVFLFAGLGLFLRRPLVALISIALGTGLSFLQGVVIMTQVFGIR